MLTDGLRKKVQRWRQRVRFTFPMDGSGGDLLATALHPAWAHRDRVYGTMPEIRASLMANESPKNAKELRDWSEVCVRGGRGAPSDRERSSDESEEDAEEIDVTAELREATGSVAIQAGGGQPAAAHAPKRRVPTQHV